MSMYFDHNASNLICPEILKHHIEVLRSVPGNAGSPHKVGRQARSLIEEARDSLARAYDFDIGEVTFCQSGTEALNLAIKGHPKVRRGATVLASAIEHKAVLESLLACRQAFGCDTDLIAVDEQGRLRLDDLAAKLKRWPSTALVVVMAANNEVGVVQDLKAIKAALPEDVDLLVDGVQAAGRAMLDAESPDALVISSHKMRAPKGAAALLTRKSYGLVPLVHGGSQERGRRAGTEDHVAISSLALAVEMAQRGRLCDPEALKRKRAVLERGLKDRIKGLEVHSEEALRLPQTSNVLIPSWDAESLITLMDLQGVQVSSGSACTSGSMLASHVLLAMGRTPEQARSSLRLSFGPETDDSDIEALIEILSESVSKK